MCAQASVAARHSGGEPMDIEFGNAGTVDTQGTGWFIGFSPWTKSGPDAAGALRHMPQETLARTLHVKWMEHPAGDDRGQAKPPSQGRTISLQVSPTGQFRLEFSRQATFPADDVARYTLARHGDFVIWGENLYHRWFVDAPCTVLTIRWIPVPVQSNDLAPQS